MPSSVVYCSAAEIRTAMSQTTVTDDALLLILAGAASRMIDGYCGRKEDGFVMLSTATARVYPGSGKRWLWLDEAAAISQVRVKNSVTDEDYDTTLESYEWRGFRGDPRSPDSLNFNKTPYHGIILTARGSKHRFLEGNFHQSWWYYNDIESSAEPSFEPTVEVTAKWGYAATVPAEIKQATIMQSIRLYKRQQGGMADALLSPDFGMSRYMSEMDKDVLALLKHSRLIRSNFSGGR